MTTWQEREADYKAEIEEQERERFATRKWVGLEESVSEGEFAENEQWIWF